MTECVDYTVVRPYYHLSLVLMVLSVNKFIINFWIIPYKCLREQNLIIINTLRYLSLTIRTRQQIKGHILVDFYYHKKIVFVDLSYAHILGGPGVWR